MTKREYLESIGYKRDSEFIYCKYNAHEDYCEKIIDLRYKNIPYALTLNVVGGINSLKDIEAIKSELKILEDDFKEMKKYED